MLSAFLSIALIITTVFMSPLSAQAEEDNAISSINAFFYDLYNYKNYVAQLPVVSINSSEAGVVTYRDIECREDNQISCQNVFLKKSENTWSVADLSNGRFSPDTVYISAFVFTVDDGRTFSADVSAILDFYGEFEALTLLSVEPGKAVFTYGNEFSFSRVNLSDFNYETSEINYNVTYLSSGTKAGDTVSPALSFRTASNDDRYHDLALEKREDSEDWSGNFSNDYVTREGDTLRYSGQVAINNRDDIYSLPEDPFSMSVNILGQGWTVYDYSGSNPGVMVYYVHSPIFTVGSDSTTVSTVDYYKVTYVNGNTTVSVKKVAKNESPGFISLDPSQSQTGLTLTGWSYTYDDGVKRIFDPASIKDFIVQSDVTLNAEWGPSTESSQLIADTVKKIKDIPASASLTLEHKSVVAEARKAYDGLAAAIKPYVDDVVYSRLTEAESVIDGLEAAKKAADEAAAKKVSELIAKIQVPLELQGDSISTGDNVRAVWDARAAYNNLTTDQQKLIKDAELKVLTDAESVINARMDADQAAIDAFSALVAKIPDTVTLDDEDVVFEAGYAYSNLTFDQEHYVFQKDKEKLDNAKKTIDELQTAKIAEEEAAARKKAADEAAAGKVSKLIASIPAEISLTDTTAVSFARDEYDKLTEDQKALITKAESDKLSDAEAEINRLEEAKKAEEAERKAKEEAEKKAAADAEAAKAVSDLIAKIPATVTLTDRSAVAAAREAYDVLTSDQKKLIKESAFKTLTDAEDKLKELEKAAGEGNGEGEGESTEPEKIVIPGNEESGTALDATVTEGVATISDISTEDAKNLTEDLDSDTLVLDLSAAKGGVDEAVMTSDSFTAILEALDDNDKVSGVAFGFTDGTVTLDQEALKSVAALAGEGENITVSLKTAETADLTEKQQEVIKDKNVLATLALDFKAGDRELSVQGGTDSAIILEAAIDPSLENENVKALFIAGDGTTEEQKTEFVKLADKLIVRLFTTHNSEYVLYVDNTEGKTDPEKDPAEEGKTDPEKDPVDKPDDKPSVDPDKNDDRKDDEPVVKPEDKKEDTAAAPVISYIPVYRLFNSKTGEHFYTVSKAEKDAVLARGFIDEGIGFRAPEWSDTPVYRFFNTTTGEHFYAVKDSEIKSLLAAGYVKEGVAWYASADRPVYLLTDTKAKYGKILLTIHASEKDFLKKEDWTEARLY